MESKKQYTRERKGLEGLHHLTEELKKKASGVPVLVHDTICRQVANRIPGIKKFAARFELIIFVSGKKSSNGRMLYEVCLKENSHSYFVSSPEEIDPAWFSDAQTAGVCGATSTPKWLIHEVAEAVSKI